MKFCPNCGAQNEESSKFCTYCGEKMPHMEKKASENYTQPHERIVYTSVTPRSIILSIILSLVTCGIYHLVWIANVNNDLNEMTEDRNSPSGGMVILISLVTCGIYSLYWLYKMGNKCDEISQKNGNNGILMLVLGIFGLSIVSLAIMQNTINNAIDQ